MSGGLVEMTGLAQATVVNRALDRLRHLGIVQELSTGKRNRLFSYPGYLEIMDKGTELPVG